MTASIGTPDAAAATLALRGAETANARAALKDIPAGNDRAAHEAAQKFEAMFLSQMLQSMSKGVKTDPVFGGGHAEGIYRSMLDAQYAEAISKRGGVGIADAVYKEILKLQEK